MYYFVQISVIDINKKSKIDGADMFIGDYDSPEEAVEEAKQYWNHLTWKEQQNLPVGVYEAEIMDNAEDKLEAAFEAGFDSLVEFKCDYNYVN